MDDWAVSVTCVDGDGGTGGTGGAAGEGGAGGMAGAGGEGGTGGAPPECTEDADCASGEICVDNMCVVPLECTEDADCASGEICVDNMCVVAPECTQDADCDDGNQCSVNSCVGGACTTANQEPGVDCDQDGGSVCDGAGACVACNTSAECAEDDNECTEATCQNNQCGQANVANGTSCDGGNGECQAGVCEPAGPPTYDLSTSVFKPYNSLLDVTTGSGDPTTDCAVPDLSGNLGANLTGITGKCIIILPPDVTGSITLEETSTGVFSVTGTQDLVFTIDVTIAAVAAQVVIVTNSSTAFSGTGTGALPGTITLDPLTAPFNINAAATGITNCTATNLATGADVSAAICPLAGLTGGDNALPFPGDPGQRTWSPIVTTATSFQLGGGPSAADGYYLSNPAPLAGNGTQWVALSGVLQ